MGFLSTLAFIVCGCAVFKEDFKKGAMTTEDKQKSIQKGRATYTDYRGNSNGRIVSRAISTNEITTFTINNGHRQEVGVKTGRIYSDSTQKKIDEKNDELKRLGKKFYYKEFHRWKYDGKPCKLKVETETGKPYRIVYCSFVSGEKKWCKTYYNTDDTVKYIPSTRGMGMQWLNEEEATPWFEDKYCGGMF